MRGPANPRAKFDDYADGYDDLLADSVRASGEAPDYFLEYKLGCLDRLGVGSTSAVLDFGCGTGNLTERLARRFARVEGYDPSAESLTRARAASPEVTFHDTTTAIPDTGFDVVVLAGVLHHIPPERRDSTLRTVADKLVPGGRVVIFEHNPFNPLTRRAVAGCPFDDDAILLWPGELSRRVRDAGFSACKVEFIVFFPRPLAALRWLEPHLSWLWLGAQTLTYATKPSVPT